MSGATEKRENGEVKAANKSGKKNENSSASQNGDVAVAVACNGDSGHDSTSSVEEQASPNTAAAGANATETTTDKASEKAKSKSGAKNAKKNKKAKAEASTNANASADAANDTEAAANSSANAADEDKVITVNVALPNGETFPFQVSRFKYQSETFFLLIFPHRSSIDWNTLIRNRSYVIVIIEVEFS